MIGKKIALVIAMVFLIVGCQTNQPHAHAVKAFSDESSTPFVPQQAW